MSKVFVIAEAGVNHNGSLALAKQLIDVAADAGADAVKFQTFRAELLVSRQAKKAEYQLQTTDSEESHFEMIKRLELDANAHHALIAHCQARGIAFLSTPFDSASVDLLAAMGMTMFKVPSGELTNLPYLRHIAHVAKRVILSTGMAKLGEVESALAVLLEAGLTRHDVAILHATTEYPCPIDEVNLRAMQTLKAAFATDIGYSDHTQGIEVPIAAVAMGATVIEKHFTLDRTMEGPDHKASLEPGELLAMVQAIRNIERALGDGIKQASPSERKNIDIARKSIVAARSIRRGDKFDASNITAKRPGHGISPMRWDEVLGQLADRDYEADELIWCA